MTSKIAAGDGSPTDVLTGRRGTGVGPEPRRGEVPRVRDEGHGAGGPVPRERGPGVVGSEVRRTPPRARAEGIHPGPRETGRRIRDHRPAAGGAEGGLHPGPPFPPPRPPPP